VSICLPPGGGIRRPGRRSGGAGYFALGTGYSTPRGRPETGKGTGTHTFGSEGNRHFGDTNCRCPRGSRRRYRGYLGFEREKKTEQKHDCGRRKRRTAFAFRSEFKERQPRSGGPRRRRTICLNVILSKAPRFRPALAMLLGHGMHVLVTPSPLSASACDSQIPDDARLDGFDVRPTPEIGCGP